MGEFERANALSNKIMSPSPYEEKLIEGIGIILRILGEKSA
jgi:hypothetical protein